MTNSQLLKAIRVIARRCGREFDDKEVIESLAEDLSRFPTLIVLAALARCRLELRTFPTVADVIDRMPGQHPPADEAWAMLPKNEQTSVVWTDEMAQAFDTARALLDQDPVGARMAFKAAYDRAVGESKIMGKVPRWYPSFGIDPSGRAAAVQRAVTRGRLSHEQAVALLPEYDGPKGPMTALEHKNAAKVRGLLAGATQEIPKVTLDPAEEARKIREQIESIELEDVFK
jgi:hypothetical protein